VSRAHEQEPVLFVIEAEAETETEAEAEDFWPDLPADV
jgi:hypothetical protein